MYFNIKSDITSYPPFEPPIKSRETKWHRHFITSQFLRVISVSPYALLNVILTFFLLAKNLVCFTTKFLGRFLVFFRVFRMRQM